MNKYDVILFLRKTLKIFSIILLIFLLTSIASASSWSKYFSEEESSYKKVKEYHYETPYKYRDDYLLEESKQYSKTIQEYYDELEPINMDSIPEFK